LGESGYYPFGMGMPGRAYSSGSGYRYGFNGKEKDDEVKGDGVQYDYGARIYDSRLGRFLSMDPYQGKFPWFTPYQFASNTPIQAVDIDGKEGETYLETKIVNGKETVIRRVVEVDIYVKVSDDKNSTDYQVKDFSPASLKKFTQEFTNNLAKQYKDGKFKDKDGNNVSFKFNVTPFGGGEDAFNDFRNYLQEDEVGILKDAENLPVGTRTVVLEQTHLSDVKIPENDEANFAPTELGEFSGTSTVKINDQQFDRQDATYTLAHEVGHFFLSKHPDPQIRNMGSSAERHDKAGKGIFHYYPVKFVFHTSQINPEQNNKRVMETPGREGVNQANVTEFLKSIIDTGKRDVTPANPPANN